jgi:aerobic carbon-monoxide dehydrogenase large subunit
VRYVGEPVAVVLAGDPYLLADAVEAVGVEHEPLPAVVDVERAQQEGSPLVHGDIAGNVAARSEDAMGAGGSARRRRRLRREGSCVYGEPA